MATIEFEDDIKLSPCEIAGKLGVSLKVIYGQINKGRLQAVKVGRNYRISQTWLKEYIQKNKRNSCN